jgi:YihY family inner membrane protein
MNVKGMIERIDRFQRGRSWLAFPIAVVKKFGEDRAGNLAALIAYYGFFSLFPLMLVFVSVLGLVLHGNPELAETLRKSVLSQFPVIGTQIKVKALRASGVGLAVGIAGAVWAGLGVTLTVQNALNDIWGVKLAERPNFIKQRVRGLIMLVVLGTITLASVVGSGLTTAGGGFSLGFKVLSILFSLLLNFVLYMLAFRILTEKKLRWGGVFPGAAAGAVLWTILQAVGGYYVGHQVKNASEVYGTFALVLGLLVWIYLGAQLTLYCAEINVVRARKLWPRSLTAPPFSGADERTMRHQARVQERYPEETVQVRLEGNPIDGEPPVEEAHPKPAEAVQPADGGGLSQAR